MSRLALILETPMSLDCLQAAERTEAPQTREIVLRHALEWMQMRSQH